MKRVLVLAVLVACMAIPEGADAHGRRNKIRSTITLAFTDNEPALPLVFPDDPDTFSGGVSSRNAKCEGARAIKVVKKSAEGTVLGIAAEATTRPDGSWTTNKEDPTPGTYVAIATEKRVDSKSGRRRVCRSAESNPVTVE